MGKNDFIPITMNAIFMGDFGNALHFSTWLLDSRVNHHLIPSEEHVPNAYPYHVSKGIVIGNDKTTHFYYWFRFFKC